MRLTVTLTLTLLTACSAFGQAKPPLKPKSKAEATAVNAMLSAQDPDSRIKAADELITKFADTPFKAYALFIESQSYLEKGDSDKAIVFSEQALDADPSTYQASVILTKTYAATTHANDLDKAEKLAKIEKYGKMALDSLATAAKPNPNISDADWEKAKADYMGQIYMGLGIAAVFGNKIDEAQADFEKTATMDADPTDLIRAGRALMDARKFKESVVWFDKAIAAPNASDQIKSIATNDKARAQSMIKK